MIHNMSLTPRQIEINKKYKDKLYARKRVEREFEIELSRKSYRDKIPHDPVILAYVAGIMDGEGHISININKSDTCKRGFRHIIHVSMINSDLKLMNLFTSWFGGHVSKIKRPELYRKQCYDWRLWAKNEQAEFLNAIYPYLRIKKKVADLVIKFREEGETGYIGSGVTDQEFERREFLRKQVQYINRRFTRLASETKWEEEVVKSLSDSPDKDE